MRKQSIFFAQLIKVL